MITKEKQLLLKDLCARIPYGIKAEYENNIVSIPKIEEDGTVFYFRDSQHLGYLAISYIKPYLRPMSSMTKNERKELRKVLCCNTAPKDCPIFEQDFSVRIFYSYNEREQDEYYNMGTMLSYFEFLNSHHFDYRGLIKKGLASEAPEGMYN